MIFHGFENTFFGHAAGFSNTSGAENSFFGKNAGFKNTVGIDNAFFGVSAGSANTSGFANAFFGRSAVVGSTLEYGNAWNLRRDMDWSDGIFNGSAYVGFDSWIGPMLFGYGMREGGEGVMFLEIGKPF